MYEEKEHLFIDFTEIMLFPPQVLDDPSEDNLYLGTYLEL